MSKLQSNIKWTNNSLDIHKTNNNNVTTIEELYSMVKNFNGTGGCYFIGLTIQDINLNGKYCFFQHFTWGTSMTLLYSIYTLEIFKILWDNGTVSSIVQVV